MISFDRCDVIPGFVFFAGIDVKIAT